MGLRPLLNCCRMCGATSYRRVVARDEQGALRSTPLYQCSGCSVVFADPKAWRDGGPDQPAKVQPPQTVREVVDHDEVIAPRNPDFSTYGLTPGGDRRG